MFREKVISALIGTMFYAVFQPFGMSSFGWMRIVFILCIGLMAVFSCLGCELIITHIFRMPVERNSASSYMMRRGIIFQISNITLLSVLLTVFLDRFVNSEQVDNHMCWALYLQVLLSLLAASLIIGLYWRNVYRGRFYKRQLEEAQFLNGILMERTRQAEMAETVEKNIVKDVNEERKVLIEGTTKESVSLLPSEFLFAESEGNYVQIRYVVNGEGKCAMIRNSIRYVASVVCDKSSIMQCHRAFIVNLSHVSSIEGRSSGMGLRIQDSDDVIPVSKAYVAEVRERIRNPRGL